MKKRVKHIIEYQWDHNWTIESETSEDYIEFWLCHKDYGIKMLMNGFDLNDDRDIECFLEYITPDYIQHYVSTYFDRGDWQCKM